MIFHDHKAIFFHSGKTAGTAAERLLCSEQLDYRQANRHRMFGFDYDERIFLQHATVATLKRLCDEMIFSSYYKFSIVRNPFVRSLSVYYYQKKQHDEAFGSFENYIKNLPDLIKSPGYTRGTHHTAQVHYTHLNGKCVCDHIACFENLPEPLNPVRKRLGITEELQRHNHMRSFAWDTRRIPDYYTGEMVAIMQDVYGEDFETFGYSPEPGEYHHLPDKVWP
jgi:hypothetical protein